MLNLGKKDDLVAAYREFKKQARENATDPKGKYISRLGEYGC